MVEPFQLQQKDEDLKMRQKKKFDSRHRARNLPRLERYTVWIPDRNSSGVVVEERSPRSHIIVTMDGSYCRNRQHLIRMPEMEPEQETQREHVPVEQEPRARSSRTQRGRCGSSH